MVSRAQGKLIIVSTIDSHQGYEVVVAKDGSIPAEQLVALGVRAGSPLRVVPAEPPR